MVNNVLIFGYGYTTKALSRKLLSVGWNVSATTRQIKKLALIEQDGVNAVLWSDIKKVRELLLIANAIIISTPPEITTEPVLQSFGTILSDSNKLGWLGYLSSTSVYGNHFGNWVDEKASLLATSEMGVKRVKAEGLWIDKCNKLNLPFYIFRLSGIYGPGRNVFEKLKNGSARLVIKDQQFFSRIHIEDIVGLLSSVLGKSLNNRVYNLADELPASSSDVMSEAASLLGVPLPQLVDIENSDLSKKHLSFYLDSKKINGDLLLKEVNYKLLYPSYKIGLRDILSKTGRNEVKNF